GQDGTSQPRSEEPVPAQQQDQAKNHREGIVIEITRLQTAHRGRDTVNHAHRAVDHDVVDHHRVARLPEQATEPDAIASEPWNSWPSSASTLFASSTWIALPNQLPNSTGPTVKKPTSSDGIASSTSGRVTTHGDSFGACASTPGSWWP